MPRRFTLGQLVPITALAACAADLAAPVPVPDLHRPAPVECDQQRPPGSLGPAVFDSENCTVDEDCTEGVRGRCESFRGFSDCTYDACTRDDECATAGPCGCEQSFWSEANRCLAGNCRVDADCGPDGYCSPSLDDCGHYSGAFAAYYCHTADDACINDTDCVDPDRGAGYCMYAPDGGHWQCSYNECVG